MRVSSVETVRIDAFPNLLFARIETDDGLTGLGETYYGSRAVETYIHETAAHRLLGRGEQHPAELARHLRGYVGRGGSGAETRGNSALDIALWDLHSKENASSLAAMVSSSHALRIPVYNTCAGPGYVRSGSHQESTSWGLPEDGDSGPYEDLEAQIHDPGGLAKDLLRQGIRSMKIWPFDRAAEKSGGAEISETDLGEALLVLQRIRDAVGDEMDIKIELHGLWSQSAAKTIVAALEAYEPSWVEDPVASEDVWSSAEVTASTHLNTAGGESLGGVHSFRHLCEHHSVDAVICDVGWCGGISTALEIADLTAKHKMPLAFHDCTGPVGLSVATALSASFDHVTTQEFTRAFYFGWYSSLATGLPSFGDGFLHLVETPGHGVELIDGIEHATGVSVARSTVDGVG